MLLLNYLPSLSLALMQAAVVPGNVRSVDNRIAMLDNNNSW
jgi:hypothetical protein